jgi:hypothetical protein
MDTLGIEYRYESEGFDLDGVWYLPDFYLPQQECWLEIKPDIPSPIEREKAIDLCIGKQEPVVILAGDAWHTVKGLGLNPTYGMTRERFNSIYANYAQPIYWLSTAECVSYNPGIARRGKQLYQTWGYDFEREYGWSIVDWGQCVKCALVGMYGMGINPHTREHTCSNKLESETVTPCIMEAFTAARQARFEHQEGGKV